PPKESEGKQNQAQSAQKQKGEAQQAEQPASARMLNRLKDQPGRAMMPDYQKQQVDKDW
ncbi:MAG: hypothetical protein GY697_19860, partial [Desulfobacterales bacterium]|nr:hypothetical protein [Desulfobacterales bacterium]